MLSAATFPEHIRLTRTRPGCLSFEVTQTDDPLVWRVDERFTDDAAFQGASDPDPGIGMVGRHSGDPREFRVTSGGLDR